MKIKCTLLAKTSPQEELQYTMTTLILAIPWHPCSYNITIHGVAITFNTMFYLFPVMDKRKKFSQGPPAVPKKPK